MCELKRRWLAAKGLKHAAKSKLQINFETCEVECGDLKYVPLGQEGVWNNV